MVNLRSPVVKDFVTNSSSRTKPQPTFIMVNLLSLVDKPYLFPLLGLFKQVDPLMTTIFPDEITANIHHGQLAVSRGQTVSLPIMGSSSKWTLWWQPSFLSISPPTLFWGQCVRQHYLLPGFFQPCWTFAYWKSSMRTLDSAQLLTDIEVAPDSRGCGSRHLISSPTNEYQDVAVVWQITLRIPHVASCSKWM